MFLIKSFTFNPVQENTYILQNESKDCIIIDPGCYFDQEKEEIKNYIRDNGLHPVLLLNTHCHLDHVFGNKFISETYGLILHIHPDEKKTLEMAPVSGLMFELSFDNYTGEISWLKENEVIRLGNDELKIILVPGHSPGSICFYCEKQKFMIGGDVLFYHSIGRTDLPGGDPEALPRNIREKLFLLPDDIKVYPGHGPSTTIGEEKQSNPFL